MAKRRDRYEVTGNMSANGRSLKGVVFVDMGLCGSNGATTTKDGKKLSKNDLKYRKFKFESPKVAKELGLPKTLWEYVFRPEHIPVFLTKQPEEST